MAQDFSAVLDLVQRGRSSVNKVSALIKFYGLSFSN